MPRKRFIYLIFVLAALCGGCWSFFKSGHPKDEEMLANFRAHRAEFNQLLEMFLADKDLERVAPDFTRPDEAQTADASRKRISEYRELFRRLNLAAGIEGDEEKATVWLYASTAGLSVGGSTKGYAYLKRSPDLIVDELDGYRSADGKSFTAFRRIEGDWYLFSDYED